MEASLVELVSRLVPALAVIVGGLLLVRRWAQRSAVGQGAGVRVLARAGIARGATVAVVEVGTARYLVGAGEHGVRLLTELEDGPLVATDSASTTDLDELARTDAATDVPLVTTQGDRPRMGPIDRLRAMTVRTHLERSVRVPEV